MEEFQFYAILFTLAVTVSAWFFTPSSRGKNNLPPSPPSLPVIGNLHQLGHLSHRSLFHLSKKYGPIMHLKFGSKPVLVVSSSDVAREIMKTHDLAFAGKPVLNAPKKIFYDLKDLINLPYGEQWRKLRGIFMHELLGSSRVKSFNSIREDEISLLVEKIDRSCGGDGSSSSALNLTEMFMMLANDLISRAAFGKTFTETEHGRKVLVLTDRAVGLLFNFTVGEFVPWLRWINRLSGFDAALDGCAKEIDELLDLILDNHLSHWSGEKDNFVDILIGIYKGNVPGVSIDRISLKAVILDVFGAGTETSATTLVWVMTELIRHPNVMKILQCEVREVTKGKPRITDDDLHRMPYLKAVIKETFRLHPPVAIYFHAARERVNLTGYIIESETMVLINAWAIGRDSSSWQEPDKFMPERFLDSSIDFRGFDFQLVPFGSGRRICPGLGFAAAVIEHTLANIVRNFDFALPDGARGEDLDASERPGFTIGKKEPLIVVPNRVIVLS